jgi:hypothetical protein
VLEEELERLLEREIVEDLVDARVLVQLHAPHRREPCKREHALLSLLGESRFLAQDVGELFAGEVSGKGIIHERIDAHVEFHPECFDLRKGFCMILHALDIRAALGGSHALDRFVEVRSAHPFIAGMESRFAINAHNCIEAVGFLRHPGIEVN